MQKNFNFETFLEAYGGVFDEYLSSVSSAVYSTPRYGKILEELDTLYKEFPKVKDVMDMEKPQQLSKAECTALIKVQILNNELTSLEMQEVYFKGCGDCVRYLKRMKLL